MTHSEGWAKRLLGKLPATPEELLERQSYWDPAFLRLFFDWLDERIFQDPHAGLKWAEVAPKLTLLVPEEAWPKRKQGHCEASLKALAILAGAYRATSQHEAAEEQYQAALRIAEFESISPEARADLDQRLSYLRICQGRLDDAEALLAGDLATIRSTQLRAEILLKRGMVCGDPKRQDYHKAIEAFGGALQITNPKVSKAAARLHHACVHNLAYAVSQVVSQSLDRPECWAALRYVRDAQRLIKGQRNSIPRHKLQWVEGLIWRRLGHHARAERAFGIARRGFVRLRLPWEIALVSLDLCALHRECCEWTELSALAADTYGQFRRLSGNTQAVAALSLCVDAARARLALSANAGQEIANQARNKVTTTIDDARKTIAAQIEGP